MISPDSLQFFHVSDIKVMFWCMKKKIENDWNIGYNLKIIIKYCAINPSDRYRPRKTFLWFNFYRPHYFMDFLTDAYI